MLANSPGYIFKWEVTGGNSVLVLAYREEFKFFSEMDKIFTKELNTDSSVTDMPVTDEPDDSTLELGQKKGLKKLKKI